MTLLTSCDCGVRVLSVAESDQVSIGKCPKCKQLTAKKAPKK
jgi:hypothetical protein